VKTAFLNGRVVVGDGRLLEKGSVLVEGERILSVTEGYLPLSGDVNSISLEGCTLFPGFIDCHVHFCMDAGLDPIGSVLQDPDPLLILKAAESARRTLRAGVTSVRDLGGMNQVMFHLRNAIRAGIIPGPRMQTAGQPICMTGGHCWQIGLEADGPDQVRKAARKQLKAGADVLKLMATGGVMSKDSEPASAQLSKEEMQAAVEEVHKVGKKASAHAQGTRGIKNAIQAGIDSIEHGFYLDEEAVAQMLANNVILVPTLSIYKAGERAIEAGIPHDIVDEYLAAARSSHFAGVQMAREAGVLVAAGTDAGTPFNTHGGNMSELEKLVEAAYSTMEAVVAATGNAAQALGVAEELGTIEQGKLADLVLVEGNPLNDIAILQQENHILKVMKGGIFFDQAGIEGRGK
jgi:imidazolonepropionase-like amidohydrolase